MRAQELFKAKFSRWRVKLSTSGSAKTAFIVGLLSPLVAFFGLVTAFWAALYNEDRATPQAIMTPIFLFSVTVPIVFCLAGIALGIIGIKSEQRNTAISGIVISGLTLFFCFYLFFFG